MTKRLSLVMAAIFCASSVSFAPAALAAPGASAQGTARASSETGRVVIGFAAGRSGTALSEARARGGMLARRAKSDNVMVVNPPAGVSAVDFASRLAKRPGVRYAEPEHIMRASFIPNEEYYAEYQWGLPAIGMPAAWDITQGDPSVTVAVIDTGISLTHPDRPINLDTAHDYDFIDDDTTAQDLMGHGTHVSGIIAARTNNGAFVAGVAPNTTILPIRVLDEIGSGTDQGVADGVRYAVDHGADVINLSLGGPSNATVLRDAIAYALANDCVIVAASGNSADAPNYVPGTIAYPARYPGVIAVGATDEQNERPTYGGKYWSQWGPDLDLSAPGNQILSLGMDDPFVEFGSGTSMASPHVAGVAALVRAQVPELTEPTVQTCLKETAMDLGDSGRDDYFGWGLVQADVALALADDLNDEIPGVTLSSPSFTRSLDAASDPHDVYAIPGVAGGTIKLTLSSSASNFDLLLFPADATTVAAPETAVAQSTQAGSSESIVYVVPEGASGTYYIDVKAVAGSGSYTLTQEAGVPTTITASVPTTCKWGASASVSGTLAIEGGAAIAGGTVSVEAKPYGSSSWTSVATAVTQDDGTFSADVSPTKQTQYRASFSGVSGAFLSATSSSATMIPKAYLTAPSAPTTTYLGRTFTSAGYLRPKHTAGDKTVQIKCYRKENGEWVRRKTIYAVNNYYSSVTTKYIGKVSLPNRGTWKLVAYVPGDTTHAATTSSSRFVTVK